MAAEVEAKTHGKSIELSATCFSLCNGEYILLGGLANSADSDALDFWVVPQISAFYPVTR